MAGLFRFCVPAHPYVQVLRGYPEPMSDFYSRDGLEFLVVGIKPV